jgi:hypothetical protein
MALRTGRCTNDLYCSFASSQQDLQVPAEGKFVCPQCGKALSDPPARPAGKGGRIALMAGGGLALAGAGLFLAGMLMGDHKPPAPAVQGVAAVPAKPPVSVTPPAAPTQTAAAQTTSPQPAATPPTDVAAHAQTVTTQPANSPAVPAQSLAPAASVASAALAAPRPQGVAPPVQTAVVTPAPKPQPAPASPAPAAHMAQSTTPNLAPDTVTGAAVVRTGTANAPVQMAMVETSRPPPPALVTPPQKSARQAAADLAAKREADQAKKAEALADAKKARQAQIDQRKADALAAEQQREATAKAEAAAPPARAPEPPPPPVQVAVRQAPPPAPHAAAAGPSRGFSASPISGGAPPYPAELESDARRGQVTVNCRIETDGSPAGCHVISVKGGTPFKGAVLSWLNSGRVKYAPVIRNGQAVAENHQWNLQFEPN